jgi:hypothetical protein
MENRLLTNWNLRRISYVLLGLAMIVNAIHYQQWYAVLFGLYMAAMGLFAFGGTWGNVNQYVNQQN